jgi:TetR/AcrR family transcriptional regulator, cholesterol catabolism regulator
MPSSINRSICVPGNIMQKIRTFSPDEKLVEERRGQIINSAVSLFAKKGFKSTGIREISRACNMTIGNLYHYIGKKEDIMSMALEKGHTTNLDFADKTNRELDSMTPIDALAAAISGYFRMVDATRDYTNFVYKELRALNHSSRQSVLEGQVGVMTAFENILSAGCRQGIFHVTDCRLQANSIVTLGEIWAVKQWLFKGRYTIDEYIRINTEQILRQVLDSPLHVRR